MFPAAGFFQWWRDMLDATLVFCVRGSPPVEILLGMKKQGFGSGKYNGFGGKIEANEAIEYAAARELREECGVDVAASDLARAARLEFSFPARTDWNQVVYVFLAGRWSGEPIETREMIPVWFKTNAIPFEQMWADDKYWLPLVLRGKRIEAAFTFQPDNETLDAVSIREL
jgi:8-oxo-dGTP diphosphatase